MSVWIFWICGVAVGSSEQVGLVLCILLLSVFLIIRHFRVNDLCAVCFFVLGFLYPNFYESFFYHADRVDVLENGIHRLIVTVNEEPDVRATVQKLTVKVDGFTGNLLVNAASYPRYYYGEKLEVYGEVEEPFETEDFSYKSYLRPKGIFATIKNPKIKKIADAPLSLYGCIFDFKNRVQNSINSRFAEPYAGFMSGILIGARRGIPQDIIENFNITGLTHIIAISGYNISLVVGFTSVLFGFLSRRPRVILSICFVVLFVIFVGPSSAVVRSAIMGVCSLTATFFGRQSTVLRVLCLSACAMVVFNPLILVYDIGFQLSFAATFGVVVISELVKKAFSCGILKRIPESYGLKEGLIMTLSAQLTTSPLILFHFGRLSLIAPISNIVVTPFVPIAMVFGALQVVSEPFVGSLTVIFSAIGTFFIKVMILFIEVFAKVPYANLNLENFSFFLMIVFYLLLWYMYQCFMQKNEEEKRSSCVRRFVEDVSEPETAT